LDFVQQYRKDAEKFLTEKLTLLQAPVMHQDWYVVYADAPNLVQKSILYQLTLKANKEKPRRIHTQYI
jgi:hypothetical protein